VEGLDEARREPRRVRGRESGVVQPIELEQDFTACFAPIEPNGLVVSPYGTRAFVLMDGQEQLCQVAQELTDGRASILAPGDEVEVEIRQGVPVVTRIAHRRS